MRFIPSIRFGLISPEGVACEAVLSLDPEVLPACRSVMPLQWAAAGAIEPAAAMVVDASHRIGRRRPSDRDPLPLGEFLPISWAANAGSVAGRTDAPERI